jgi:hypothetical protein
MYSLPSVKRYISSGNKIEEILEKKLASSTIQWVKSTFVPAVTTTSPDTFSEKAEMTLFHNSIEWKCILENIFTALNMPPKYSGKIYLAISQLDSTLYSILFPFQLHLEFSPETIRENIAKAYKPLSQQQKEYLLRTNGFLFSEI